MKIEEVKVGQAVYRVKFYEDGELTVEQVRVVELIPMVETFRCSRDAVYYAGDFEPSVEEALAAANEQQLRQAEFHTARARKAKSALLALVGDRKDHNA